MFISNVSLSIFIITWIYFYEPTTSTAIDNHHTGSKQRLNNDLVKRDYFQHQYSKQKQMNNKLKRGIKDKIAKGKEKIKSKAKATVQKAKTSAKGFTKSQGEKVFQASKDLYLKNRDLLDKGRTQLYSKLAGMARDGMEETFENTVIDNVVTKFSKSREFKGAVNFVNNTIVTGKKIKKTYDDVVAEGKKFGSLLQETKDSLKEPIEKIKSISRKGKQLINKVANTFDAGKKVVEKVTEKTNKIGKFASKIISKGKDMMRKVTSAVSNLRSVAKASNVISKVTKVFQTIGKIGKALGKVAAALGPIGAIAGGLIDIFCPGPNIADLLEKGFKELTDKMMAQFENVLNEMHKGFEDLTNLINEGIDKIESRIKSLSNHIDEQIIKNQEFNYIQVARYRINRLMNPFKNFAMFPAGNETRAAFKRMCEIENPEVLVQTTLDGITEKYLNDIEKGSHGHLVVIQSYLIAIASDASSLTMLVPACNGVLPSVKKSEICGRNSKATSQMKTLLERITKLMREFDANNGHKLKQQFLTIIKEHAKSYNDKVTKIKEDFIGKDDDKDSVHKACLLENPNQFNMLTYKARQELADNILDSLSEKNSDLMFTVITHFKQLHYKRRNSTVKHGWSSEDFAVIAQKISQNMSSVIAKQIFDGIPLANGFEKKNPLAANDISWPPTEIYVSPQVEEKKIVFHYNTTRIKDLEIVIFWHRMDHQPVGPLWDRCIDEESGCWYDEKPICQRKGTIVSNPSFQNLNLSKIFCTENKTCEILELESPPKCKHGKECFKKCSSLKIKTDTSDVQTCYNSAIPCYHNTPECVELSTVAPENFFPNGSNMESINGESCIDQIRSKNLREIKYIGGYQSPSCITNINKDAFGTGVDEMNLKQAIIKATALDCTSIFAFPQPVNFLPQLKQENKVKTTVSKEWKFNDIGSIGKYIEDNHEMKDLGYCLLGIFKTWRLDDSKPVMGIATNMNGLSMAGSRPGKHTYSTSSYEHSYDHEDRCNYIKSKKGKLTLYPHMFYIVKNCEKENEGSNIEFALKNETENCQAELDEALELGHDVKEDHDKFIKTVESRKEGKGESNTVAIALGVTFGVLVILALVGSVFFVVSRRGKKKNAAAMRQTSGKIGSKQSMIGRGSAIKRTSSGVKAKDTKLGSLFRSRRASSKGGTTSKSPSNQSMNKLSRKSVGNVSKTKLSSTGKKRASSVSTGKNTKIPSSVSKTKLGSSGAKRPSSGAAQRPSNQKISRPSNQKLQRPSNQKLHRPSVQKTPRKSSGSIKRMSK